MRYVACVVGNLVICRWYLSCDTLGRYVLFGVRYLARVTWYLVVVSSCMF